MSICDDIMTHSKYLDFSSEDDAPKSDKIDMKNFDKYYKFSQNMVTIDTDFKRAKCTMIYTYFCQKIKDILCCM